MGEEEGVVVVFRGRWLGGGGGGGGGGIAEAEAGGEVEEAVGVEGRRTDMEGWHYLYRGYAESNNIIVEAL